MSFKNYIVSFLLFGLTLLLIVGCGREDEDFVGSWQIVSIDGLPIQESFSLRDIIGGLEHHSVEVSTNDFVFESDNSWYMTIRILVRVNLEVFDVELQEQFDQMPISMGFIVEISGTYVASGSSLTLVAENGMVKALLKPDEFWWDTLGVTEDEFGGSRLGPIATGELLGDNTWVLEGNRLILTDEYGSEWVLNEK